MRNTCPMCPQGSMASLQTIEISGAGQMGQMLWRFTKIARLSRRERRRGCRALKREKFQSSLVTISQVVLGYRRSQRGCGANEFPEANSVGAAVRKSHIHTDAARL